MSFPNDIQIFIAMPYTDMGEGAKWKKPDLAKMLYEKFRATLAQKLNKNVVLTIENQSVEAGTVHGAMLQRIYDADILLADITGARHNVLFELGIRYGLCRGLTLITSQDDTAPFDVAPMRTIKYANRLDDMVVADLVAAVENWLREPTRCDSSPMVELLNLKVVRAEQWERVSGDRIKTLITASKNAKGKAERLRFTEEAVKSDPYSIPALLEYVKALRTIQDYHAARDKAIESLEWFPECANLHKELGIVQDRLSDNDWVENQHALDSLTRAIQLNPTDADAHCCKGGVLRRRGLREVERREDDLNASIQHYEAAIELTRHSTYAGLNIVRLWYLVLPYRKDGMEQLKLHLRRMYHLCEFEVTDSQRKNSAQRWWQHFDLGDALVMSERPDDGFNEYNTGINLIPTAERRDVLLSPLRAWNDLIAADALQGKVLQGAETVTKMLMNEST